MAYAAYDLVVYNSSATPKRRSFAEDFSAGVMEFSLPSFEVKELPANDWKDVEGEEVYVPEKLLLGAGDLEVKLCYRGERGTFWSHKTLVLHYLLQGGKIAVQLPYAQVGYTDAYFKGISEIDVYSDDSVGDVVTYKLKFRVCSQVESEDLATNTNTN